MDVNEEKLSMIESDNSMLKSLEKFNKINLNIESKNDEIIELFDYKEKTFKIISESLIVLLCHLSYMIVTMLIVSFSKPGGRVVFTSIFTAGGIYLTFFLTANSFSLGYGILVARYYSAKEFRNLSLVTGKAMLIAYSLGIFLFVIMNIFCELIIRLILSEEETILKTIIALRILSVSIIVWIPYDYYFRYFSGTENFKYYLISTLISDVILIISLLISSYALHSYLVGIVISYDLFTISVFIGGIIIYYHFNPVERTNNLTFLEITDNISEYMIYSVIIGATVVLSYLSNEIIPIIASIIDDDAVGLYYVVVNLIYIFTSFSEAISYMGTIELNHFIGVKNFKDLKKIVLITFLLISGLVLIIMILLIIFFKEIISIYTADQKLIERIHTIKYQVIFSIIMNLYQLFFVETLCSLNDSRTPFLLTLINRYFLFVGLSYIFKYYTNMEFSSIANSLLISSIIESISNGLVLVYRIKNVEKLNIEESPS